MAISFAFFAFEIIRHSFCHSEVRRDFAGLFERGFEVFDPFARAPQPLAVALARGRPERHQSRDDDLPG